MTSSRSVSVVEQARRIADENAEDLIAIVGPTATGKTALAVELAEKIGGEVIGADSVQVYRGFDVGSGKPSAEEMARAPHHLVGTVDPLEHVDASTWAASAADAVRDIRARGRRPVLCGGTFLWVKALLYGLAETPRASASVRERHRALAASEGRSALHDELRAVDPEAASRLHPNDFVRVSRALEVYELTGKPLTAWQAEHGFATAVLRARLIAIRVEPAVLTERIRSRARAWLGGGAWEAEVRSLVERGYGDARAMGSVGYSQVRARVAGTLAPEDLETAVVRATRVFARRQRTWLNHADVTWLSQ
jgi:tRNA dimethylallyltransferase